MREGSALRVMGLSRFAKFAWGVLFYNLLVILWGAFVRASGSGDGCGAHWPLCNGEVIPVNADTQRWIEFSHRVSSGLVVPLVMVLMALAYAYFGKGHPIRKATVATMFFTITEALVGMMLVKLGWVDKDESAGRAFGMALHLINTFFLLASLTLTAHFAGGGQKFSLKNHGAVAWGLGLALFGVLVLGVSGAVTALGDTLRPLADGTSAFATAIDASAHYLEKLRPIHPLVATSVGLYLLLMAGLIAYLRPTNDVRRMAKWVGGLFVIQMAIGMVNVVLKAPIWMQMVHLFFADLIWIAMLLLTVHATKVGVKQVELNPTEAEEPEPVALRGLTAVKRYVVLTKPRVISLLLFTTLTAMFIAAKGWPGFAMFFAIAIGGYMSAGAANTINMVIDRDIDGTMKRTAKRPTVTQEISSQNALAFGLILAVLSFAIIWIGGNLLAAMMSLAGLVFYVIVYTLMLKRRTWHNIVIGGAAGAFPPLVGYAAVTNELPLLAWILFAIIFAWTPVHFWALALLIKDDYAKAGIPMLPVVHGERITVIQIALYAVLTAIISMLPLMAKSVGPLYLFTMFALNLVLGLRCLQLYKRPERPQAVTLYKSSMVYLALVFLVMAIDRVLVL